MRKSRCRSRLAREESRHGPRRIAYDVQPRPGSARARSDATRDAMPQMTGGDAVAESLIQHGVEKIFGLPGAQLYGLFDAFARRSEEHTSELQSRENLVCR